MVVSENNVPLTIICVGAVYMSQDIQLILIVIATKILQIYVSQETSAGNPIYVSRSNDDVNILFIIEYK